MVEELTEAGMLAARRYPATLAGYLELHIEQGPVLEGAGIDIGIVTGISGSSSFRLVFEGDARHAGTTPMNARLSAASVEGYSRRLSPSGGSILMTSAP